MKTSKNCRASGTSIMVGKDTIVGAQMTFKKVIRAHTTNVKRYMVVKEV